MDKSTNGVGFEIDAGVFRRKHLISLHLLGHQIYLSHFSYRNKPF